MMNETIKMKTYDEYKDSGIDWIGEIPKGWEIKRIKFISSSLDDGDWVESKDQVENGEYKLIQLKNIGEGKIIKTIDKSINKKFFEKNNCREITDGDLLIARIPEPILRCSIFNKNRFPNSISVVDATIITLKKEYYNKFVEYYFNSHYSKSIGSLLMYGATRQRISRTNISNMNIFLPSLKQQEQIVDYLDNQTQKIDKLIGNTQNQINKLKEYEKSLINRVVKKGLDNNVELKDSNIKWIGEIPKHWEVSQFKRIIQKIKDGTHSSFQRVDEGKKLLSAKNVFNWGIEIKSNESLISNDDYNEIVKNGFPKKEDILLTVVGTIGRSFVYNLDYPLAFQRSVCFLRLRNNFSPYFYNYYIQSTCFFDNLMSLAKTSAQSGVYMGDVVTTIVVRPPIKEQEEIAEYLDNKTSKIQSVIKNKEKQVELYQELRKTVINNAVTGKIKVC